MSDAERLMRPQEVAEIYDVKIKTVARWIKSGHLPATRTPGGRYRVPAAAVEALLKIEVETNARTGKVQRQMPSETADRLLANDLEMLPRLAPHHLAAELDMVEWRVKRGRATPQDTTYLAALREEITRRQTTPTP